jgi:hypothetical protein
MSGRYASLVQPAHPDTAGIVSANQYLTYQDMTPADKTTAVVEVIAVRNGALLGTIRWFGRWRKYAFHAEPYCWFDPGCLEEIAANLTRMTETWRERRKRS